MTPYESFAGTARSRPVIAGLILGSGMSEAVDALPCAASVAFGDIPGLPATAVHGHRGRLTLHELTSRWVIAFQGRLHYYEGHSWDAVDRCVRVAHDLGVRTLLFTNAAGGIGDHQQQGSLMAITGHIAATRPNWWHDPKPRSPYAAHLLNLLQSAADRVTISLPRGIYASLTGPCYETPAEIRALKAIGADAVGMSTAHEAETASGLGIAVAAVSLITNRATGLAAGPLDHTKDVLTTAEAKRGDVAKLIRAFLDVLAEQLLTP